MKIPENAELKFKGIIFDVYQWQQEMFDGSFETFEGLKRGNTVVIIPIVDGKFLINDEEQPSLGKFLTFPCGRIDKSEESLESAKRELSEETGYESNNWEKYMRVQPDRKIEWTVHVFIAKNCKKTKNPKLDPGEKIVTKLVDFEELKQIFLSEEYRGKELALKILNDEEFLDKLK